MQVCVCVCIRLCAHTCVSVCGETRRARAGTPVDVPLRCFVILNEVRLVGDSLLELNRLNNPDSLPLGDDENEFIFLSEPDSGASLPLELMRECEPRGASSAVDSALDSLRSGRLGATFLSHDCWRGTKLALRSLLAEAIEARLPLEGT